MKSKIIEDHKCRVNSFCTSPQMDRIAKMVSEDVGRNANNQATISHGYQVLALREMQKRKIDTKHLYSNINH